MSNGNGNGPIARDLVGGLEYSTAWPMSSAPVPRSAGDISVGRWGRVFAGPGFDARQRHNLRWTGPALRMNVTPVNAGGAGAGAGAAPRGQDAATVLTRGTGIPHSHHPENCTPQPRAPHTARRPRGHL